MVNQTITPQDPISAIQIGAIQIIIWFLLTALNIILMKMIPERKMAWGLGAIIELFIIFLVLLIKI